ncbi:phosphatase PAP2 family protein [Sphingomonas piscis]|uniref:Phosphatase PAP2 family protein n=1 Tax=Sphingomonas piscis TaxID=2714943 RepID=A0A6G7YS64_9SPHN|nr:phosphatase PAP2 family protein [Sphingomonas piscis]QIK79574.1 phosphatase PAP2 family protein [Sphingomonas piscis]
MARKPKTPVEKADLAVAKSLTPLRKRKPVKIAGTISDVGDQPPMYLITGAVLATGVLMGDRRTAKVGFRMLASHFVAIRLKNLAKRLVDRTRPDLIPEQGKYELRKGQRYESDYNSFPSGHTASPVAIARALGREFPGQHGAALAVAGTIGSTQVIRSKHYLSDVVAGALIGLAAEAIVDRWLRQMAKP